MQSLFSSQKETDLFKFKTKTRKNEGVQKSIKLSSANAHFIPECLRHPFAFKH